MFATAIETTDRPATISWLAAPIVERRRPSARDRDHDRDRLPDDLVEGDRAVAADRRLVLEDEARDVLARLGVQRDVDRERSTDPLARMELDDLGRIVEPGRHAGLRLVPEPAAEPAVDDRVDVGRVRPGGDGTAVVADLDLERPRARRAASSGRSRSPA